MSTKCTPNCVFVVDIGEQLSHGRRSEAASGAASLSRSSASESASDAADASDVDCDNACADGNGSSGGSVRHEAKAHRSSRSSSSGTGTGTGSGDASVASSGSAGSSLRRHHAKRVAHHGQQGRTASSPVKAATVHSATDAAAAAWESIGPKSVSSSELSSYRTAQWRAGTASSSSTLSRWSTDEREEDSAQATNEEGDGPSDRGHQGRGRVRSSAFDDGDDDGGNPLSSNDSDVDEGEEQQQQQQQQQHLESLDNEEGQMSPFGMGSSAGLGDLPVVVAGDRYAKSSSSSTLVPTQEANSHPSSASSATAGGGAAALSRRAVPFVVEDSVRVPNAHNHRLAVCIVYEGRPLVVQCEPANFVVRIRKCTSGTQGGGVVRQGGERERQGGREGGRQAGRERQRNRDRLSVEVKGGGAVTRPHTRPSSPPPFSPSSSLSLCRR